MIEHRSIYIVAILYYGIGLGLATWVKATL